MHHVYSTLTCSNIYSHFEKDANGDMDKEIGRVLIEGGANVCERGFNIVTPLGKCTEITDEQLEICLRNETFKLHQKNGFITVISKKSTVEKTVKNMEPADKSAPKTPKDFPEGDPMKKVQLGVVGGLRK